MTVVAMRKFKHQTLSPVTALFESEQVRRVEHDHQTFYAAEDIVRALVNTEHPDEAWADLKRAEPALGLMCETLAFPAADGSEQPLDAVRAVEALRIVQAIPSPRAERVRLWLAESGLQRIEEQENPELAVLRTTAEYRRRGYTRRWIDKRLRGISTRQELAGEWKRRGALESDDYRQLTNELFERGFGMDVQVYRRYKGLSRPTENLRDHMTDLELVLTGLAEATATELLRDRDARGMNALTDAARDAGEVVAATKAEIERRSGKQVAHPGRHWDRRVA